jgi:hypothetical protein
MEVAAQAGTVNVWGPSGILVASLQPGKALGFSLAPATGVRETTVDIYGQLRDGYILTDELSNVSYKLQGTGLNPLVGKWVDVKGTIVNPSASAPLLVSVSAIDGQAGPGASPAGRRGPSIISPVGLILLIVVVAAGVCAGLYAANAGCGSTSGPTPVPVTPSAP